MPKVAKEYLRHIKDEINILISISKDFNEVDYSRNEYIKRTAVRCLEIIGEAVKNLPVEYRELHPEIYWKSWAGLRDKLIHNYIGVDYQIVWDIITNEIPELNKIVTKLLKIK